MRRALTRLILLAALLAPAAPSLAAEDSPVRTMMEASGLAEQLGTFGRSARAGILQGGVQGGLPPALFSYICFPVNLTWAQG